MLLFLISFLLIFTSSYLISNIISPKKSIIGIINLFLIAFAQIVLTFEVLSLFTLIKQFWILGANIAIFVISFVIWHKKSKPRFSLDWIGFKNKAINSFKLDKSLIWLFIGYLVLIFGSIILCTLYPITSADSVSYHVSRCLFWITQGNLNHFNVADIRCLCLPINSEILYSWVLLFVKKDVFLGFFAFVGYLLSIISIYNILGFIGYCVRKRLWVIFILSSFSSVIVQLSGTETDIIIAGLTLSCIFLFWYSLRNNNNKASLFMSSLAYALALGTKTTAIIMIPAVAFLLLFLCFKFKKYKPLALFLGFGIINFLLFSAFNYVQNLMNYSSFFGPMAMTVVHKNYFGFKGMISNFIKYIFMFFDFTGLKWSDYVGPNTIILREFILKSLHLDYINDGVYTTKYIVNRMLLEPIMGAGVLGFLVYLPCVVRAFVNPLFRQKSRKTWFIFGFAVAFIINLLSISYLLVYMSFSVRFIMSFMVLSSPVLVYSYFSKKNPLKYIIMIFSLYYLIGVSTHLWARPLSKLGNVLRRNFSITYLRDLAHCKDYEANSSFSNGACVLVKRIRSSFPKGTRVLAFINTSDNVYYVKALELEGYKIDVMTLEDANKINFDKYDIVITTNKGQSSTVVKDYEARKNEFKVVGKKAIISKENDVPCWYVPNPLIQKSNSKDKSYPFQVKCAMTTKFLHKKHLELISIAGVVTKEPADFDYYQIYKNTNLP